MLGAAHVLAMDSKNLLDVVDSIRIRFLNEHSQLMVTKQAAEPPNIILPAPVSCTIVQTPAFPQKILVSSNTSASNVTTTQIVDS